MSVEHLTAIGGSGPVLVSDFDGTMTRHDFYKLAIEKLLSPRTPDYWAEYRKGTITHFEALRRYFAEIREGEDEVLNVVNQMELEPDLPAAIESLKIAGWKIIVTSAGCEWYIRRLLSAAKVDVIVYANPGRFEHGKGLIMEMPIGSPYLSQNLGIDKKAVVEGLLASGKKVAFAGDGFPDAEPARLVRPDMRFARGDLANVLKQEQLDFHGFHTWSDIAHTLLGQRE